MKSLVAILFTFSMSGVFAQQGRHEMPIDTISIGGKEQDVKMTHLEGYEELLTQLTEVRDSISNVRDSQNQNIGQNQSGDNPANESLSGYEEQLDDLINEMKKKEKDELLMRRGFSLLDDIRRVSGNSKAEITR